MGAYVSTENCEKFHSVKLDCTIQNATEETPYPVFGGIHYGEFEPNPDIAGIGVLYAFFSVAALALLTSSIYLILQTTRRMKFTGIHSWAHLNQLQETSRPQERHSVTTTLADVFEGIILSCSDQQVFTSGAYALTLRYAQGCKISAYHYNIVANMLLITCATHLMSVTVVSKYWKHKLLALFRIILITLLFIVTALLLANQNAGQELQWPTATPLNGVNETPLVLQAACFQTSRGAVEGILQDSFGRGSDHLLTNAIGKSTPNNHIQGWNFFLLMVLWYGFAIFAEAWRYWIYWYHGRSRSAQEKVPSRFRALVSTSNKYLSWVFWFYQAAGTVFCIVAIVMTFLYIQSLRNWMNQSPWIKKGLDGTNPEYDATTFGQLVPLLLTLLTVFATLQLVGDKFSDFRNKKKRLDAEAAAAAPPSQPPSGLHDMTSSAAKKHNHVDDMAISSASNQHYGLPPEKKHQAATVQVYSVPPTPPLEINNMNYRQGHQQQPPRSVYQPQRNGY